MKNAQGWELFSGEFTYRAEGGAWNQVTWSRFAPSEHMFVEEATNRFEAEYPGCEFSFVVLQNA